MPYATSRQGTRIHYTHTGDRGPHVVLIQGLGLSGRFWFDQPAVLAKDPEAPYQVLTIDNRGTGLSDKPVGPYNMRRLAEDVHAVLEHAQVRSAYIVGISLGGMIAQHVALRYPDRVQGLVLIATSAGWPFLQLASPWVLGTLTALPLLGKKHYWRLMNKLLLPRKHQHRASELFAAWPAAFKENPVPKQTFFAQMAAASTHSAGFSLRKLKCPTVVVTGAEDVLIPRGNGRLLAKLIPQAELIELEEVGHAVPLLAPDVIRNCLQKVRTRAEREHEGMAKAG